VLKKTKGEVNDQYYHFRSRAIIAALDAAGIGENRVRHVYADGRHDFEQVRRVSAGDPEARITPDGAEEYLLNVAPEVVGRVLGAEVMLAAALNEQAVKVYRDGAAVVVRALAQGKPIADSLTLAQVRALDTTPLRPGELMLGSYADGDAMKQLVLDLNSPSVVHLLVAGATGSGKTNLMQSMALSAMTTGAQIALFDPAGRLAPLGGHRNVWRSGCFQSPSDCVAGLAALARRIDNKADSLALVFIDELADLIAQAPDARAYVARIAASGRQFGLHLVVGTQYASVAGLGRDLLGNLRARVVGHVPDATAAYTLTGMTGSGAESLQGAGAFVLAHGGAAREFRAPLVAPALLAHVAKQWPAVDRDGRSRLRVPAYAPIVLSSTKRTAAPMARLCQESAVVQHGRGRVVDKGRPVDIIPGEVLAAITEYYVAHGEMPSGRWVNERAIEFYGKGWSTGKRARALAQAQAFVAE
jgi:hypothetical protein